MAEIPQLQESMRVEYGTPQAAVYPDDAGAEGQAYARLGAASQSFGRDLYDIQNRKEKAKKNLDPHSAEAYGTEDAQARFDEIKNGTFTPDEMVKAFDESIQLDHDEIRKMYSDRPPEVQQEIDFRLRNVANAYRQKVYELKNSEDNYELLSKSRDLENKWAAIAERDPSQLDYAIGKFQAATESMATESGGKLFDAKTTFKNRREGTQGIITRVIDSMLRKYDVEGADAVYSKYIEYIDRAADKEIVARISQTRLNRADLQNKEYEREKTRTADREKNERTDRERMYSIALADSRNDPVRYKQLLDQASIEAERGGVNESFVKFRIWADDQRMKGVRDDETYRRYIVRIFSGDEDLRKISREASADPGLTTHQPEVLKLIDAKLKDHEHDPNLSKEWEYARRKSLVYAAKGNELNLSLLKAQELDDIAMFHGRVLDLRKSKGWGPQKAADYVYNQLMGKPNIAPTPVPGSGGQTADPKTLKEAQDLRQRVIEAYRAKGSARTDKDVEAHKKFIKDINSLMLKLGARENKIKQRKK